MIWHWLKWVVVWVFRLLIPNPYPAPKHISKDRACAVCGNTGGRLKFDWYLQPNNPMDKKPMVFHTCGTCGFVEALEPVSIPRYPVDLSTPPPPPEAYR